MSWPENGPRILVFGNRTWSCFKTIENAPTVIHGAAIGADQLAADAAFQLGFKLKAYPISSDDWNRIGPRAGYVRNRRIADEGKPHVGLGFGAVQKDPRKVDRSGSGHILDILNELGIRVTMIASPGDYPGVFR